MEATLHTLLLSGADELAELATVADQLGTVGLADIERWQSLDRLSQHLAGLATFLSELAVSVPDLSLDVSDTLSRLKTQALADRLAGHLRADDCDAGALELFGA